MGEKQEELSGKITWGKMTAVSSQVPEEKLCRNKSPPLLLSLALFLSLSLFLSLYHQVRITYQVGGRGKGVYKKKTMTALLSES